MKKFITLLPLIISFACNRNSDKADAYGNFETDEITVSSEVAGKIIEFQPDEGMVLKAGTTVAVIDTVQLYLRKKQMEASLAGLYKKLPDQGAQLAVYDERIKKLTQEEARFTRLVNTNAASKKSLDDIQAELELNIRQRKAAASSLGTQTQSLLAEVEPLRYQLMQVEDQLSKCYIQNPINGTVLNTLVKASEVVQPGKPLYQIAPLDPITLRAYVVETQLSSVKLGGKVTVKTDGPGDEMITHEGTITWISSEAEFTPKIIQTKDERASQVYAVKIEVKNGGALKIGMPGEVYFIH